ncbi:zinc knuckle protein [Rutstroemia sp. NJR-2017a BBW]|nr:zinc knuckle protein [Rutstroemia sp. NJR-2017a BBW]
MGNSETSTVYAAELQGIKLALEIADEDAEKGNKRNKLIIFTDTQAAIRAFQNPAGRSGAYIVAEAIRLIDKLQTVWGISVEIRWNPAHIGIWGNEAADKAAKAAAKQSLRAYQGNSSATQIKTYHLQATLKTWIMRYTRAEWAGQWESDQRGRTSYKYTQEPTHKVLRLHHGLKKWQSALLIQMRTEKIGLKDHLWRRKVPEFDDPGCDCGEGRQTVSHVLLRCRKYRDLRRREFGIQGRMDLRAILNESKSATKAIRFMEQTHLLGQFRRCGIVQKGEVEHWGETEDYPGIAVLRTAGPVYDIINHTIVRSINNGIDQSTPWSRPSPRSVTGFTKECKEAQMKARRLRRIAKRGVVEAVQTSKKPESEADRQSSEGRPQGTSRNSLRVYRGAMEGSKMGQQ